MISTAAQINEWLRDPSIEIDPGLTKPGAPGVLTACRNGKAFALIIRDNANNLSIEWTR